MEWVLVAVLVLGIPVGVVIWLIARAMSARDSIDALSRRVGTLESELFRLKRSTEASTAQSAGAQETIMPAPSVPEEPAEPAMPPWEQPLPTPPPLESVTPRPSVPPSLPAYPPPLDRPEPETAGKPPRELIPAINWEQFMGVKLFAWIGGLALFLGVAFFVKYSFENNLVSPELRVALGFLAGLGLLVGRIIRRLSALRLWQVDEKPIVWSGFRSRMVADGNLRSGDEPRAPKGSCQSRC